MIFELPLRPFKIIFGRWRVDQKFFVMVDGSLPILVIAEQFSNGFDDTLRFPIRVVFKVLIRFYNWNHFRKHTTHMGILVVKRTTKEK